MSHSLAVRGHPALTVLRAVGVAWLLAIGSAPRLAAGTAETDYARLAGWLFDQYLVQAVTLTRHSAERLSPSAGQAIDAQRPQLLRFLERHRSSFLQALTPILRSNVPEADAARIAARVEAPPVRLDPREMSQLAAVDAAFRQNEQRILRAMTFELNLIADQILQNAVKSP
jgi:hypothetical protein